MFPLRSEKRYILHLPFFHSFALLSTKIVPDWSILLFLSYWVATKQAMKIQYISSVILHYFKPIFHYANLFARREAKTRIRQRDWLKLTGEKIRREQV